MTSEDCRWTGESRRRVRGPEWRRMACGWTTMTGLREWAGDIGLRGLRRLRGRLGPGGSRLRTGRLRKVGRASESGWGLRVRGRASGVFMSTVVVAVWSVRTRLLFAAGRPESPSRSPLPRCPASSGLPHPFSSALPPSSLSSVRRPASSALGSCHFRPVRRPRSVPVSRQTTPNFSALALVCPLLPEPFQ